MPTELPAADPMQSIQDAIHAFPTSREATHCGETFPVSPFAIYSPCPVCKKRIKVRAFASSTEIEDIFDAVFEWMNQPGASRIAKERMQEIASDKD